MRYLPQKETEHRHQRKTQTTLSYLLTFVFREIKISPKKTTTKSTQSARSAHSAWSARSAESVLRGDCLKMYVENHTKSKFAKCVSLRSLSPLFVLYICIY